MSKIEKLFNNDRLDIEFCSTKNTFYILQCRPLKKIQKIDDEKFNQAIVNVKKKIKKLKIKFQTYLETLLFLLICPTGIQLK